MTFQSGLNIHNNNNNITSIPPIIGNSDPMKQVFSLINKASKSDITVCLFGETGTGKEVVAKTIHHNSRRANKPFIPVNVSAIPRDLIESELFGFEKGSFTGAISNKSGKFEEAQNGTIFIDEISDMDISAQVKLLRVLQEQQVTRIGSHKTIDLNVRIIIASNKNLADEVAKGTFREDLYYRLLGLSINLPPLRDRGNDIIILAEYFIKDYCQKNNIAVKKLSDTAKNKLLSYNFPGNVRELKSLIELAIVMSDDDIITDKDFNLEKNNKNNNSADFFNSIINKEMTMQDYNRTIIMHYLKKYNNKVRPVAKILDIGKSTIYRMLS